MRIIFLLRIVCLYFLMGAAACIAAPFTIAPTPGVPFPTTFYGTTLYAYYTVKNNTKYTLSNAYVKYLPPTTSQWTSGGTYSNTCGATFSLSPAGTAGDSCILQLSVTGAINGNDPDPHNHLFVCLPGGTSCAGTATPLNILQPTPIAMTVSPATADINALTSIQYTASVKYSDGTTQNLTSGINWDSAPGIASITTSGLATGVSSGYGMIKATLGALSSSASLYVTSFAYLSKTASGEVDVCPLLSDGSVDTCRTAKTGLTTPNAIAINPTGTFAYIGSDSSAVMKLCTINTCTKVNGVENCPCNQDNGTFCACSALTPTNVTGIAINSTNTTLYLTTGSSVDYCPIMSGGSLGTCLSTATIASASAITLNPTGTYAYVASSANTIYYCSVNTMNNSLNPCNTFYTNSGSSSLLDSPVALAFIYPGNILVITNSGNNTVTTCVVNLDGSMNSCSSSANNTSYTFTDLHGAMFNGASSFLYLVGTLGGVMTPSPVTYCQITYDGVLANCNAATVTGSYTGLAVS